MYSEDKMGCHIIAWPLKFYPQAVILVQCGYHWLGYNAAISATKD